MVFQGSDFLGISLLIDSMEGGGGVPPGFRFTVVAFLSHSEQLE